MSSSVEAPWAEQKSLNAISSDVQVHQLNSKKLQVLSTFVVPAGIHEV